MKKFFLGIDTSCYTTSLCLLNENGQLIADVRRLLQVKAGNRGLRQSEMVFQHTRNLPELWQQAWNASPETFSLSAVGVSAYPRSREGSYMPAFLTGSGYAQVAALCQQVPLHRLSHQENHIYAGIWSAGGPAAGEYLALHLSGGTTEILKVIHNKELTLTQLGGSQDIHAGQLIDRIGVLMQLTFPAGPALERLAATCDGPGSPFPVAVRELEVSFAGPENHAKKLLAQHVEPSAIAAGLQYCVAKTIAKLISRAVAKTGLRQVLLVGGVTANQFIRDYLTEQLQERTGILLYFPQPAYSADNAVGAAYYAWQQR